SIISYVFLVGIPHPPRSMLFPYTPLFRSVVDRGDVIDHRSVPTHRVGGLPGERLSQPAAAHQADERGFQALGDLLVPLVTAPVQGHGPDLLGTFLDHAQQVTEHRHALVALV